MDDDPAATIQRLSERQRQCLQMVADGRSTKEIARSLGLSPSTVDNHVRTATMLLNVADRRSAARIVRGISNPLYLAAPVLGRTDKASIRPQLASILPPLGGTTNSGSAYQRMVYVLRVALVGVMGMSATVVVISGVVSLFAD